MSLLLPFMAAGVTSCGSDDEPAAPAPAPVQPSPTPGTDDDTPSGGDAVTIPAFATGADVSWLTQLEAEGEKFYASSGKQMECMQLLKEECGVNAIRLRVWVNPADGWCNAADLLVKARRANALGLPVMVDFHFSDTWADPQAQTIPAAWGSTLASVKAGTTAHITEVLTALAAEGITPAWVQVGNETCNGMLWPLGKLDVEGNSFAELVAHASATVRRLAPEAKIIVHTDQGDNPGRIDWVFGPLKAANVDYDIIGVSFYPELDWDKGWLDLTENQKVEQLMANLNSARATYGKDAMVVEFGMNCDRPADTRAILADLLSRARTSGFIRGVFYWEPEAPAGYNGGYQKGAFASGRPTEALAPFRQ